MAGEQVRREQWGGSGKKPSAEGNTRTHDGANKLGANRMRKSSQGRDRGQRCHSKIRMHVERRLPFQCCECRLCSQRCPGNIGVIRQEDRLDRPKVTGRERRSTNPGKKGGRSRLEGAPGDVGQGR